MPGTRMLSDVMYFLHGVMSWNFIFLEMFPVLNDNQNDNLTITISAQEGEDVPVKEDVPIKGKMCPWRGRCAHGEEDVPMKGKMWPWRFGSLPNLNSSFRHAFWKGIWMRQSGNTVKRFSELPKTITSDPKSHFVFGVLPIAHMAI